METKQKKQLKLIIQKLKRSTKKVSLSDAIKITAFYQKQYRLNATLTEYIFHLLQPEPIAIPTGTLNLTQAEDILETISPDLNEHDWFNIMKAVHSIDSTINGLELVDAWSTTGTTYDTQSCVSSWSMINPSHKTTGATLKHYANKT